MHDDVIIEIFRIVVRVILSLTYRIFSVKVCSMRLVSRGFVCCSLDLAGTKGNISKLPLLRTIRYNDLLRSFTLFQFPGSD